VPQLRTLDYGQLQRRAFEQHQLVEAQRLQAAQLALVP
jgi:hypothetical protein